MTQGLYYLASPYQGSTQEKAARKQLSLKAAAEFLRQGIHVFAPLVYVSDIVAQLEYSSVDELRKIVMPYDFEFLSVCSGMILLTAQGWEDSWGVRQELKYCQENGIPVYKITPEQLEGDLKQTIQTPLAENELRGLLLAA